MMVGGGFSSVEAGLSGLCEDIENGYGEYGAEDQSAYEGAVRHGGVIKKGAAPGWTVESKE
jgi:hypothetical protein